MSPMTSLVATNRMQQCAYWYLQSISVTISLLHYVGNKTDNYCYCYCYYYYYFHHFYHYYNYVYDKGCWHMYIDTTPFSVSSIASSSSCPLAEEQALPHLIGLNWFAILHRYFQFGSLLGLMQPGNFHYLLHMENISCRAVSGAVAPHIHWITSCSSTCMPHSWSLGLGTTGTGDRKCLHMTALSVEHGSHASPGILTWYKLVWLHLPVPSTDGCFSARKWFIHWTSDYFFIPLNLFLARGILPGKFCLTFEEKTLHSPGPT